MIKTYRTDVGMFHLTYIFKIIDNSIGVKRIIIYVKTKREKSSTGIYHIMMRGM